MTRIFNFSKVTSLIPKCSTFSEAKKLAGQEFVRQFFQSNDEVRQSFTKELFSWAMNSLHSHEIDDRVAALTGLAFYLNFIDKEPELQNLIAQLERILPAENILIITGTSYLFEHINRKITTPFIPRLFERCASWIATRPTPHAILSSALIMKRLYFCSASNTTNYNSILSSVVNAAFKFDNPEAQNTAVELCMMSLSRNPSVDEATKVFISDSIVVFESRSNGSPAKAHAYGYLLLLTALMKNYRRITTQRFSDFFSSFLNFLTRNFDKSFIEFIAFFCESYKEGTIKYLNEIQQILKNSEIDYSDVSVCTNLCRIIKVFPEEFCEYAFEVAKMVLPKSNSCFFDIISAILSVQYKKVDHQTIFTTFTTSPLSISVLQAMNNFLICFPQYTFKFLAILHPLIKEIFEKNPERIIIALEALRLFSRLVQFSCDGYWSYCMKYLSDSNKDIRIKTIRVLYAMCELNQNHRHETTINILFNGQNDPEKDVRMIIMKEFPEWLLDTFSDASLVSLVEQFIDDVSTHVGILAIELIGRIRKKFPVNTLSTFWTRISHMDVEFFHTDLINERKKLILKLPSLIKNSGEFSIPLYSQIIEFISTLFQNPPPLHQTFEERVNQRHDEKCDRLIRISCLHVVQAIGYSLNEVLHKVSKLTNDIINQLYISSHPTFHIEVLRTLRCIFRCVNVLHDTDINGLELINKLLSFIQNNHNPNVLEAFTTLFGTIGPLDPYWFHSTEPKQVTIDSSQLSDPSKREKCYLDFVMGYIVDQLQSKSRNHEPTTLINAIVYIFQSDASNCIQYLDVIVKIFVNLFNEQNSSHESLFRFLRSIILLVDVAILPHAQSIMQIVQNFLPNGVSIEAVRTVNALIYSLKSEFGQFGLQTFKTVISVLNSKSVTSQEIRSSFLLTLTLLTIYSDGCTQEFFTYISSAVENKDSTSQNALMYLSQAIASGGMKQLVLPSLKLALSQVNGAQTTQNAIQLLYVLIAKYPDTIMMMPVDLKGISPVLDELISTVKHKVQIDLDKSPFAKQLQTTPDPYYQRPKMQFDPKSVQLTIEQGRFRSTASEGNWTAWALNFSQELALCSRSPAIRACLPLLMSSTTLHLNIFPLIFLSVWENTSVDERQQLSSYIRSIISQNVPQMILHLVSATCESLDRANFSLFPDEPLLPGQISERCNSWFRALRFYASIPKSDNLFLNCLRIETQLKRKDCALGLQMMVPQECTNCDLLENLNMWSKAREIYMIRYKENDRNDQYLIGLLKCSVPMDDWDVICERFPEFPTYSKKMKQELGTVFGAAAISKGIDEKPYFESVIEDDPSYCYWRCIASIKKKDLEEAINWISRGRNSIVRNEEIFASGNYEPAIPTICYSMIFEELNDVIDSFNKGPDPKVLNLWSHKLDYLARDPTWLRMVSRSRSLYNAGDEEKLGMRLFFFNSLRMQGEWELFDKLSQLYLPDNDPRVRLLYANVRFDRGITKDTQELKILIEDLKKNGPLDVYCNAVCSFASRTKELSNLLEMLNDVIKHQPNNCKAWKYFAYTNLSLSGLDEKDSHIYANNAMKGFISLIDLKSNAMHYLCQLCSIFFNNAKKLPDFDLAAERLMKLPPESVDKIMPQLLTQLSHTCESCRNVAFKIIEKLADENYHALSYSLSLIRKLDPSSECISLIDKIEAKNISISQDLHAFTESLIYVAVLPFEQFLSLLNRLNAASNQLDKKSMANIIQEVIKFHQIYNESNNEWMKKCVNLDFWKRIQNFSENSDETQIGSIFSSTKNIISRLTLLIEQIDTIDVNDFDIKLSKQKSFSVAIPGLNCISQKPILVSHVHHILKTMPSAQHPRKMSIVGTDGITYKYLLKGGVDLRLDLHVMQLFSLINSILVEDKFGDEMHSLIHLYGVTPLSRQNGLISWAEGGKTLYSLIKWYRKLRKFPITAESKVYLDFVPKGKESALLLTRIQRYEIYNELLETAPSDQLRQVLWLKSPCAESWLIQATNFARSTSLMSFVGYIIGLGDRHPSNILVMEKRGNVVHIDLSEVFEKAALRKTAREVVPFRLTRMIVDALGPSGVHGVFSITARNVMNALRRNQSTILAFLDIFTKENIVDMIWYQNDENDEPNIEKSSLKKAISKLEDKLNFREFGEENPDTDEHVSKLISIATDPMNLSQMYLGWSAYW